MVKFSVYLNRHVFVMVVSVQYIEIVPTLKTIRTLAPRFLSHISNYSIIIAI